MDDSVRTASVQHVPQTERAFREDLENMVGEV